MAKKSAATPREKSVQLGDSFERTDQPRVAAKGGNNDIDDALATSEPIHDKGGNNDIDDALAASEPIHDKGGNNDIDEALAASGPIHDIGTSCNACRFCGDICEDPSCESCSGEQSCLKGCPCSNGFAHYYTMCQVRRHNHAASCWLVAGDVIYDATDYLNLHPGGPTSLLRKAGGAKDCTADLQFHSKKGRKAWERYIVGKMRACPGQGDPGRDTHHWWMFWA